MSNLMEKSMKRNVPVPFTLRQLLSLALLLLVSTVMAQNLTLKGRVIDTGSEPVIGANVLVEGTTNGTITDFDGFFTLQDVPGNAKIVVSFIGYKTQTISLKGEKELKITLRDDTELIDEVVVIGYGTTSTRKMASSVTAVKGEKLQDLPFDNVAGALQGRASGVIVQQSGGEPGSVPSISVRGGGSPIYVIDGVISDSWDFNTLNAVDIESMSILKDAASLAVYGSRAANGIVMIKTKQGGKGKTAVTYSFSAEFSQPTMMMDKTRGYDYALHQNMVRENDFQKPTFDADQLEAIRNQTDPYNLADTDWQGLALKNFAPQYKHSLSLSGTSGRVNYYVSLGAFNQGGLYRSNSLNYDRYNIRSNINTTFDEIGLKVGVNINSAIEKKERPSTSVGRVWELLADVSPLQPAYNEDGTYRALTDHPLVLTDKRSGYNNEDDKYINVQLVADWTLPWMKELTLGTMFNYRGNDSHVKNFSTKAPQYNADGSLYPIAKPTLKEDGDWGSTYNFELSAAYLKTFAEKHTVDAKAVFTVSESDGSHFWASRKEYMSAVVDQLFAGSQDGQLNSGTSSEGGRMGFVGRLKYDYDNRYIIEGSFRYDGSDNFAPGHRWGFFPSGAVAWAVSEEPFFKNLEWKFVNLLKLRASYGQTGTEAGVNRFGYLSTYSMDETGAVIGGNLVSGFNEGNLVAPELLSWYTVNSLNYGLDFSLLKQRLTGSLDYFYYVTKGGLMSPGDRYTTPLGKSLPQIKSDSEQRREGFEFALRWRDTTPRKFTYEVGVNMTYYNNLWKVKADESETDLKNPWKRQTHQTDYYGIAYYDRGFYQTPEQIVMYPRRTASSSTRLGDLAYEDVNGDGKIDGEDQVRIGMPTSPHFTYGIDFSFNYEGFTLSGLLYGTGDRYIALGDRLKKGESKYLYYQKQLDYWRPDHTDAAFPRVSTSANVNGSNNQVSSTFWFKNGRFLRLKNLSLSYDLKYKLLKSWSWINTFRVNVAGTNLLTFSGVNDYFDPETADASANGYPVQRVYSIGATIGF